MAGFLSGGFITAIIVNPPERQNAPLCTVLTSFSVSKESVLFEMVFAKTNIRPLCCMLEFITIFMKRKHCLPIIFLFFFDGTIFFFRFAVSEKVYFLRLYLPKPVLAMMVLSCWNLVCTTLKLANAERSMRSGMATN